MSKDIVSRVWRKIKSDWDAWNARSLAAEPIVRLIFDGTVVRVRLDRKATSVSLLVVLGVREEAEGDARGQEHGRRIRRSLALRSRRSDRAWPAAANLLVVDGAPGLEKAIAAVWDGVPVQRCTVHKHRNLLAHAPSACMRKSAPTIPT